MSGSNRNNCACGREYRGQGKVCHVCALNSTLKRVADRAIAGRTATTGRTRVPNYLTRQRTDFEMMRERWLADVRNAKPVEAAWYRVGISALTKFIATIDIHLQLSQDTTSAPHAPYPGAGQPLPDHAAPDQNPLAASALGRPRSRLAKRLGTSQAAGAGCDPIPLLSEPPPSTAAVTHGPTEHYSTRSVGPVSRRREGRQDTGELLEFVRVPSL